MGIGRSAVKEPAGHWREVAADRAPTC